MVLLVPPKDEIICELLPVQTKTSFPMLPAAGVIAVSNPGLLTRGIRVTFRVYGLIILVAKQFIKRWSFVDVGRGAPTTMTPTIPAPTIPELEESAFVIDRSEEHTSELQS